VKFVFVLHDAELYGASYAALDLAIGLDKLGHQCIFTLPVSGPFMQVLNDSSFAYHIVPYQNWAVFRPKLYQNKYVSANRLKRIFKLFQFGIQHLLMAKKLKNKLGHIDWVITNNALVSFGFILAQTLRAKHMWQFREFVGDGTGYEYIFSTTVRRYIYSFPAKFIYSSKALQMYYGGLTGGKGKVFIEPHIFLSSHTNKETPLQIRIFGMLGSVNENKGQLEILGFFKKLLQRYPDKQLLIAGTGQSEIINAFIYENKLEKSVIQREHIDKYDFFNNVDCVIVNSKFEGFGRVAIEAMKSRKLLLGRKSTGTYELIGENERGFLFENETSFLELIDNVMTGHINLKARIETAQQWAEINTEPVTAVSAILNYLESTT
jgi:L-malate glycosyltransferase